MWGPLCSWCSLQLLQLVSHYRKVRPMRFLQHLQIPTTVSVLWWKQGGRQDLQEVVREHNTTCPPPALWRFGQILTARIAREQRSSACLRPPQMNVRETAALCPAVNLWHIISLRMTMLGQCKMLLPLLATSSVASSQAVPGRWSLCATHLPQSGRPCQDYDPCNPGWHSGSLDR